MDGIGSDAESILENAIGSALRPRVCYMSVMPETDFSSLTATGSGRSEGAADDREGGAMLWWKMDRDSGERGYEFGLSFKA